MSDISLPHFVYTGKNEIRLSCYTQPISNLVIAHITKFGDQMYTIIFTFWHLFWFVANINIYHSLLPRDRMIGWDMKMTSHPNTNASFINIWDRLIWRRSPNLTRSSKLAAAHRCPLPMSTLQGIAKTIRIESGLCPIWTFCNLLARLVCWLSKRENRHQVWVIEYRNFSIRQKAINISYFDWHAAKVNFFM